MSTTVYLAVLLSFFNHGVAQDTVWTPSKAECESIVRQWAEQPEYEVGKFRPVIVFRGYCRPMQVESEWPLKASTNG